MPIKTSADSLIKWAGDSVLAQSFEADVKGRAALAEEVVSEAKRKHPYKDQTGQTTSAISSDVQGTVVAIKVLRGRGFWLELGFRHSKSGKRLEFPYIEPALESELRDIGRLLQGI